MWSFAYLQHTAVKQLLTSPRHENLGAQSVAPVVQERQLSRPFGSTIASDILDQTSEAGYGRAAGRVTCAMSMQDVDLGDVCSWWKWVLVCSKSRGWEVRAVWSVPSLLNTHRERTLLVP